MNSTNKVVLGLTGYYCSGKSAVEKIIAENYNFLTIDVDKLGHEVLEEKKDEIVYTFGSGILEKSKISRKKLGQIVFSDKKKLRLLNSIVHPRMIDKVRGQIEKNKNKPLCINAALLFDMNLDKLCNIIFIVKTNIWSILKRAKRRDGSSIFKTLRIINSQKGIRSINKKKHFADISYIGNNKKIELLKEEIDRVLKEKKVI